MGFSEAVRWWEEWQLRILVLTSLFLRCFLSFAGVLRKRTIPSWLRFIIWLAYVSSDAVAIYGLATLFNQRQKTQESSSAARLQVLWAPILLIHLGGQNGITAYNIEDNELWRRHVLTAVSQVAVAVYVFRNSLPEDRGILALGVGLFVIGVLKCVLKPWDLKRVSINSLVNSSVGSEENRRDVSFSSLDQYIRAATEKFQEDGGQQSGTAPRRTTTWKPYDLFVDLTPPYSDRLSCLEAMALLVQTPDTAHGLVRYGLSTTFDRLYTKESLLLHNTNKLLDGCIFILRFFVTVGSLVVVVFREYVKRILSNLDAYDHIDASITLLLIGFIMPVDYMFLFTDEQSANERKRWPDQVAQYNLIEYLARNKKHKKLRWLTKLPVCKDYIDQLWCMMPSKSSSREISKLVHAYIAKGWTEHHIRDMVTYRAFNDNRGQWTLRQEGCSGSLDDWGLRRPFDESVLLWHLATDFCFHLLKATPPSEETAQHCRVMSNYMVYLLFVNPEMLMTGARRSLFREAYRQLKETLKLIPQPDDGAGHESQSEQLARKISHNIRHARGTAVGTSLQLQHRITFVGNAWKLAKRLERLRVGQDDAKMWRVIQGVWVEMLCFSAGRCRGYLHAKSLGKGGEYLSYVWLLMSYMGMETLAERMQRNKLEEEDATNNGGSAHGTTAAIPVPTAVGAQGDGTTEASTSTPTTEGVDVDGTIPASPVTTTNLGGDDGRTAASPPVKPSSDDNV